MLARRTRSCAPSAPRRTRPASSTSSSRPAWTAPGSTARTGRTTTCAGAARDVREAARARGRPVALLFDLQGPKLRLSGDDRAARGRGRRHGHVRAATARPPTPDRVAVDFDGFARRSSPSARRSSSATACRASRRRARRGRRGHARASSRPARCRPRKGINVTYARPELPAITEKDLEDLDVAVEIGRRLRRAVVRALGRRHRAAARRCSRELGSRRPRDREDREGRGLRATSTRSSPSSDGMMVARGDYGVEAGVARVPLMQKDTILPRDAGRARSSSPPRRCSSR